MSKGVVNLVKILGALVLVGFIIAIISPSEKPEILKKSLEKSASVSQPTSASQVLADTQKSEIKEKLKAIAARDWPDDFMTQEYWVNGQMDAYEYMLTIAEDAIKNKAQRDWPLDFMTQKYWYNEQIASKERMK